MIDVSKHAPSSSSNQTFTPTQTTYVTFHHRSHTSLSLSHAYHFIRMLRFVWISQSAYNHLQDPEWVISLSIISLRSSLLTVNSFETSVSVLPIFLCDHPHLISFIITSSHLISSKKKNRQFELVILYIFIFILLSLSQCLLQSINNLDLGCWWVWWVSYFIITSIRLLNLPRFLILMI